MLAVLNENQQAAEFQLSTQYLEGLFMAETRESGIFELPKAVGGPMGWMNSAS